MKKEFTIKVKIEERWIPHFLSMLKMMEYCGKVGKSRYVCIMADGDGDFHPEFEFENVEFKEVKPVKETLSVYVYDAG